MILQAHGGPLNSCQKRVCTGRSGLHRPAFIQVLTSWRWSVFYLSWWFQVCSLGARRNVWCYSCWRSCRFPQGNWVAPHLIYSLISVSQFYKFELQWSTWSSEPLFANICRTWKPSRRSWFCPSFRISQVQHGLVERLKEVVDVIWDGIDQNIRQLRRHDDYDCDHVRGNDMMLIWWRRWGSCAHWFLCPDRIFKSTVTFGPELIVKTIYTVVPQAATFKQYFVYCFARPIGCVVSWPNCYRKCPLNLGVRLDPTHCPKAVSLGEYVSIMAPQLIWFWHEEQGKTF